FSDSSVRHGSISHPAKRMRLCAETSFGDTPTPAADAPEARSKFFKSPKRSASSPVKQTAQSDFNLWSDDSIEDAMAQLPDPSAMDLPVVSMYGVKQSDKAKIAVFEDGAQVLGEKAKDDSQGSNTTRESYETEKSQGIRSSLTPATSVSPSQEE